MYLLDTNLLLEVMLAQEKAEQVKEFLQSSPRDHLFLSNFSLYSIGIHAVRRGFSNAFVRMVDDLILQGGIRVISLSPDDMPKLVQIAEQFHLDFDDAYQYVLAAQRNLQIVSLDADFDRTDLGRKTPAMVLEELERAEPGEGNGDG